MLVNSSVDEVKRREAALRVIKSTIKEKGRNGLYDLTGLSGGFPLVEGDIRLLETYAGSAIFEDAIQVVGRIHLGGDKILALNRTSSGILAAILALVKEGDEIVHYLPKPPAHPSIPRSAELVGASYREFDDINDFEVGENTSLVFITGSTMDHEIIDKNDFLKVIKISKSRNIPVFVDDASGARLRTVIYKQPRAMDMGADMAITSTDKLMDGPRGGLMAGKADIMDLVKSKAQQFGLEAQSPLVAGMVRAFENFSPEKILEALSKKHEVYNALKNDINSIKETPTGVMLSSNDLKLELENKGINTQFSALDLSDTLAMLLLRKQNIITIPAVGMPGASPTIRIDLASQDAGRVGVDFIVDMFKETFSAFESIAADEKVCRAVLYD